MVKRNTPVTFVAVATPSPENPAMRRHLRLRATNPQNPEKLDGASGYSRRGRGRNVKVCAVVGETDGRTLRILGVARPSRGVRKGEIVDLAIATECVHDALADAETNSDAEIGSVLWPRPAATFAASTAAARSYRIRPL